MQRAGGRSRHRCWRFSPNFMHPLDHLSRSKHHLRTRGLWVYMSMFCVSCWCLIGAGRGLSLGQVSDPSQLCLLSERCIPEMPGSDRRHQTRRSALLVHTSRQRIVLTAPLTPPATGVTSPSPIRAKLCEPPRDCSLTPTLLVGAIFSEQKWYFCATFKHEWKHFVWVCVCKRGLGWQVVTAGGVNSAP